MTEVAGYSRLGRVTGAATSKAIRHGYARLGKDRLGK